MIFADDTQIYASCEPRELNQALAMMSNDVNAIFDFSMTNGLKLNIHKPKIMIFRK